MGYSLTLTDQHFPHSNLETRDSNDKKQLAQRPSSTLSPEFLQAHLCSERVCGPATVTNRLKGAWPQSSGPQAGTLSSHLTHCRHHPPRLYTQVFLTEKPSPGSFCVHLPFPLASALFSSSFLNYSNKLIPLETLSLILPRGFCLHCCKEHSLWRTQSVSSMASCGKPEVGLRSHCGPISPLALFPSPPLT